MILRQAKLDDSGQLAKLLTELGYAATTDEVIKRLNNFNRDLHQVIVADQHGSLVGFIAFGCYEHFISEGRCLHIESLVVDKEYRGQGIGRKLVIAAEEYAKQNKCKTIELITLNRRMTDGTHDFYKNIGYKNNVESDYTYFSKDNL